jgi:Tfp pilus assembly protein PilZ
MFEFFSRPTPLFNFTKSGFCFNSDKKFRHGEKIHVDIKIPNEKSLRLVGEVRWIDENRHDDTCTIGAQFSAFGKGRNYNPIRALEKLRRIQQKYK